MKVVLNATNNDVRVDGKYRDEWRCRVVEEHVDHVEHAQQLVLFTAVEAVDDNDEPGVVIRECIHAARHVRDRRHFLLEELHEAVHLSSIETAS